MGVRMQLLRHYSITPLLRHSIFKRNAIQRNHKDGVVVARREQAALRADNAGHHHWRLLGNFSHDRDRRIAILN